MKRHYLPLGDIGLLYQAGTRLVCKLMTQPEMGLVLLNQGEAKRA